MDKIEALNIIKKCVQTTCRNFDGEISENTHLVDDGILDSLDSMNFLFELETELGDSIPEIDEDFEDFRVSKLIEIILTQG